MARVVRWLPENRLGVVESESQGGSQLVTFDGGEKVYIREAELESVHPDDFMPPAEEEEE